MSSHRTGIMVLGVLAAVGFLAALLLLDADDGGSSHALTSYYFEARLEVIQPETDLRDDEPLDTVRGWYESPGKWRWEFSDSDPARSEEGSVEVSDGEAVWLYDRPTNTYYSQPLAAYNQGRQPELSAGPPIFAGGLLLGWIPYGDEGRFFEPHGARVETTDAVIAGRQARRITFTRDDTTTVLWVDDAFPFMLKSEVRSSEAAQSPILAEVVDVRLNDDIGEDAFAFEPPADAREVDPPDRRVRGARSSGGASGGTSRVDAPDGFRSPGYVPQGFIVVSIHHVGSSVLGGDTSRFTARLEAETTEGYLEIDEQYRAGGLPESQRTGRQISIGSSEGYDRSTGDMARLVWAREDIVITLTSDVLPTEELLRIAESM